MRYMGMGMGIYLGVGAYLGHYGTYLKSVRATHSS